MFFDAGGGLAVFICWKGDGGELIQVQSHFSIGKYAEYDGLAVFVERCWLGNDLTFVLGLTRFDGCLG